MAAPSLAPEPAGPCQPSSCRPSVLPSLLDAPERRVWRPRSPGDEGEVEEIVFLLEGQGEALCSSRACLRSQSTASSAEARITFANQTGEAVRMCWADFNGHECPYTILQPGQQSTYRTWPDHVWVARSVASARRMVLAGDGGGAQAVVARAGHLTVPISTPPSLVWSEASHCGFPRQFRAGARALLLCWQRLGTEAGAAGRGPVASLGSLPDDLVRAVIEQLAPTDLWQESRAAAHPGIPPVPIHSWHTFQSLARHTAKHCGGRLPPAPRLSAAELLPPLAGAAAAAPAAEPGSLGAAAAPPPLAEEEGEEEEEEEEAMQEGEEAALQGLMQQLAHLEAWLGL